MSLYIMLTWALLVSLSSQDACNHNNCYRAFNGDDYTSSAQSYCSKYTTATSLSANNIPWASKSCSMAAQISSICSCAYPAGAAVKTTPITPPSPSKLAISSSSSTREIFSSASSIQSSSTSQFRSTSRIDVSPVALQTSTATYKQREFGPGCFANNCLRALDRYNANDFCSIFTLGGIGVTGIPSYATPCTGSTMAQVSSACTCLNDYDNTAIPVPTGTASILTTTLWIPLVTSIATANPASSTIALNTAIPSALASGPVAPESSTTFSTSTSPVLNGPKTSKSAPAIPSANGYCYANNCLRALKREGGVGGTAFCASFTSAIVTNSAALPTYATQCSTNAIAQMSSACTCIGSQAYATS